MTYSELKYKLITTKLVEDNEWLDKYCKLLINSRLTSYDSSKANYHHAIPRVYFISNNLLVDNSIDNIFILLYKDHVLAHFYLAMAAKDQSFKYKMLYAVRFVISGVEDITERNLLLKLPEAQLAYEETAKLFSINNIAKNPVVAEKISEAHKNRVHIQKDGVRKNCRDVDLQSYLDNGWQLGWSDCNYCANNKGKHFITKDGVNIYCTDEELNGYLESGWSIGITYKVKPKKGNRGHLSTEARKRQAEARKNSIAIHNLDGKVLYIKKEDAQSYLDSGWLPGTGLKTVHKDNKEKHVPEMVLEQYLADGWLLGK